MSLPANQDAPIQWPTNLRADRAMTYEAIELLHSESKSDTFGYKMAFIVTCSNRSTIREPDRISGVVHKLDITAVPHFTRTNIAVTHEVCPNLGAASRISTVNNKLKAIGFDSGAVVPVTNFGSRKTFNCDVRGRLEHHSGNISSLASNSAGTQLASGCTDGTITLYQVRESEISFLSKTNETRADHVTHMAYLKSAPDFPYGSMQRSLPLDDSILLFSSTNGGLALVDTRCKLADHIYTELMLVTKPRINITSFATVSIQSRQDVYLGGRHGEIFACDLRQSGKFFYRQNLDHDGCIGRLEEIIVQNGSQQEAFLAYTNGSDQLQILDLQTMKPDERWKCVRRPGDRIRDFVHVDDKIVTSGDKTTIGCWTWNPVGTRSDDTIY